METKLNSKGKRFFAPAIAAGLMLAMAFTLNACGGDGGGGDDTPSSSSSGNGSPSSSSSGGDTPSSSSFSSGSSSSGTSSSSSGGISSSSSYTPGCTAANNTQTQYCSNGTMKTYGSVTYEGQAYKTVVIGNQTWMAENLNFNATGSRCYGDNTGGDSEGNCAEYGRLYGWNTAMGGAASSDANPSGVQGVCPSGWHLPSNAEWQTLIDFAGGDEIAGTKLKSTSGWHIDDYYIPGTDGYGFSALPGGLGDSGGDFNNAGYDGFWWSASEYNSDYAYGMDVSYNIEDAGYNGDSKDVLYSVRCLQD